jgi:hypothetical protein
MKKIQMLAGCILVLAMAATVRAETYTKPAAITIVGVQGEARYSTDGKIWHPLVIGKILRQGAVLETASGSTVDLTLSGDPVPIPETSSAPQSMAMLSSAPDPNVRGYTAFKPMAEQNVIRMQSNTMLAVDQLSVVNTGADTVGNTELDLRSGNIFCSVKKMSASSQFIVKLPNGVAGIRGTTCSFGDHIVCYSGTITVVVMGRDGKLVKVSVQGGFAYDQTTEHIIAASPELLHELREFGISARTLFSRKVIVTEDDGVITITPTEGKRPVLPFVPTPPSNNGG